MNPEKVNFTNKDSSRPVLTGRIGPHASFEGKDYLYFAGNNYLNLAGKRELREAAIEAVDRYGTSFGAGRTTTGTAELQLELEELLARFKGREDAMIFSSGYLGNQILLKGLVEEGDHIFYDKWAHPSLKEGIPLGDSKQRPFPHNDTESLKKLLQEVSKGIILVNGVDPCTGEIAPLDQIAELIEGRNFKVLVDDAHSTGVLGENSRGTLEHFGIKSDNFFQTETMSKALGSFGGFIASGEETISRLREVSPTYRGSTPLPPAVVGASKAAVEILLQNPRLGEKVRRNAEKIAKGLTKLGLKVKWHGSAIIRLEEEEDFSQELSLSLKRQDVIVPFIHYPDEDSPGRLRLTASSGHTQRDIDLLIKAFKRAI